MPDLQADSQTIPSTAQAAPPAQLAKTAFLKFSASVALSTLCMVTGGPIVNTWMKPTLPIQTCVAIGAAAGLVQGVFQTLDTFKVFDHLRMCSSSHKTSWTYLVQLLATGAFRPLFSNDALPNPMPAMQIGFICISSPFAVFGAIAMAINCCLASKKSGAGAGTGAAEGASAPLLPNDRAALAVGINYQTAGQPNDPKTDVTATMPV